MFPLSHESLMLELMQAYAGAQYVSEAALVHSATGRMCELKRSQGGSVPRFLMKNFRVVLMIVLTRACLCLSKVNAAQAKFTGPH